MKTEKIDISANEMKEQGNKLFSSRKYSEAITCYTKAISKNPTIATYFTNRALCFLKQKQWESACKDCKRALEIDPNLVKGHFFQGQAQLELGLYDEAISSLHKDLGKDQRQVYGDEITGTLRIAKKRRWNKIEEKRIQQEIELQLYMNTLIQEDKTRKIEEAKKLSREKTGDVENIQIQMDKIEIEHNKRLEDVNNIFAQIDDRRKKREVPDYLCGKISFELMRDPVITPSGITYDKKDIEEHLQRVGHFDPVTRKDLTQDKLTPNLAMKEVVDVFIEENPWVEDF